jgi:hypothetical protein
MTGPPTRAYVWNHGLGQSLSRVRGRGTARQWLVRSPRRLALIGGTGGLVMIGLGVGLAATGRKD